ncbi:MAG: efflux RND transporter permease subunit [Burkholderiaceae bacterium]|nr:efflux RND transporter permease subunit [Burkholderiaceae bacterium]
MNFATWSIRNPIPSILLFLGLALAGLWGFRGLNIQNFPDLDLPAVNVTLVQPGAAPAQLETEVARKVEDSLATLQGLKHIATSITDGRVSITTEFDIKRSLSDALLDVKDAVDRIRSNLPTDVEEPQISKVTVGPGGPILTYALSNPAMDEEALSWFVDDTVAKRILKVPGAADFTRLGGVLREVKVELDPAQLAALGATAADVSRALKQFQVETSGGAGKLGGQEQGVRTLATVRQAHELAAYPINLANGHRLRLDQVARITDGIAERTQIALLDGKPAIGFQVSRTKGYDEASIGRGVEQALAELKARHPDLGVTLVRSSVEFTLEQYKGSMEMLYEGALLAVLVIWWFLKDWRATIIGAAALPLSIIPAFAVMAWFGYSLNTITLLALAVVVGILVDDAIVEVENVARHLHQGKSVLDATIEAVNEIALAVIATTATLVVVFVPTALMSGIPGLVFKQFGWTIVAAVIASLLVARLITPVMATWILRRRPEPEKEGPLMGRYLAMARWCLQHPKITLLATTAFFAGSVALLPLIPTGFIPARDEGNTSISIELPPGASLDSTLRTAEETRKAITGVDGVRSVFASVGSAPSAVVGSASSQSAQVRKGSVTVVLTSRGDRPPQKVIEAALRDRIAGIPGARLSIGSGTGTKLQVILSSPDAAALKVSALSIEREMRALPFLSGISSTATLERPEITIRPDLAAAAELGVSTQSIGDTVRIALSGDFDAALAKLNSDARQIYIRAQIPTELRDDLQAISALRVPGRNGALVPLESIADIAVESGPSQIDRYNRERQVTITADLGGYPLGRAIEARDALPSVKNMPSNVRLIEAGDAEMMGELIVGFIVALLTGVLLVYAVLVLLFKDWFMPLTILSAVPFSIGGVFVALLAGRFELSLPVLIGLVMLLGIVTKNSILLADFAAVAYKERGLPLFDALVDACSKRARPIVMTTVAMVAGMLPMAFGLGGDASFRQPMAVAVIGGLLTSTGLSLLVVPVVFAYVVRFETWLKTRKAARRLPNDEQGIEPIALPAREGDRA